MHSVLPICLLAFQALIAPGLALWRGGAPERLMASLYLAASLATSAVSLSERARFHSPELGIMALDAAVLASASWIAVRANRWWPIWFSAMQGVAVLTHLWRLADPSMPVEVYYVMTSYVAYPLWMLILAATLTHDRRLARYGEDPSWKRSSPAMASTEPASGRVRR